MNRLWVRLTLAFGLVTATAIIIAALLANYQVSTDFRRFMMHNQMVDQTLEPALVDYYARHGSWAGVESLLRDVRGPGGNGRGHGMRQGAPQLLLIDANRQVGYDESGQLAAARLGTINLEMATAITWQGQTVGYLLVEPPPGQAMLSGPAQAFLGQINRALLQAGLIAGGLGLLLGLVIARGLAAPLGRLAAAARRISQGELSQRVPTGGASELAGLAIAFNDMAANLEQAETLRRNLVADVAHELRTPLSVVQGNLRAILDDVYPLDKAEIASIYDETLILNRLIADLRELAQAEAGQLSLNLQPTALPPLIEGVVDLFKELAREQGLTLAVELPPGLPLVLADADRVRQVLHNLLANAVRHTPAGGRITLLAEPQSAPQPGVRMRVADTGPGIPPTDLPHIFDRFWRADKSRSREQGGSGLGLAIARQLIELHGGQIGADSEGVPGRGSCFWFSLPLSQNR